MGTWPVCGKCLTNSYPDLSESDERDNSSHDSAFDDVSWTEGSDHAGRKTPPTTSNDVFEAAEAPEDDPEPGNGHLEVHDTDRLHDVVASRDLGHDDFGLALTPKKVKKIKKSKKKNSVEEEPADSNWP